MPNLFTKLDGHAITVQVQAGAMLFRRGDPVIGAYTMRKGRIALIWTSKNGVNPMDVLRPGAILGLPAVLNGEYSLSAKAVEDCELGFLPVQRVVDLLSMDQGMLQEVTKLLASEVARMRELARSQIIEEG